QSAPVEQRARSALHAELPIKRSLRVGDQRERHLGLVLGQFLRGGVEDDDLPDAVGAYLVVASDDRALVKVADRAAGEAPELKVDAVSAGFRDRDLPTRSRWQSQRREG